MTSDHGQEDWVRAAFARSRDAYPSSPAPVDRILTAARTRRKRRRAAAALASAACVLGLGLAVSFLTSPPGAESPASRPSPRTSPPATPAPSTVSVRVAEGTTGGQRWSVALEFHRTLPKGYTLPTYPDGTTAPGTSLLCQRMYIGGVRIDHQGGPWADCQPVTGTHDPQASAGLGLWGLHDKGLSGSRLMVSNPEANVAYGIVSLSDGTQAKATTVTVPGTTYRAWAAPIPNGRTITSVDQYDAHDQRLSHDTGWR
ncbi:hypothetical protein [Streptomyces sp. SP2-10]|uniref:hypothetical protein n=1 Tax=Streptomyces sp. SP2-10 TaxID=2873385 RepID=UPI001CA688DF|nr:hypothetical protein [Streptomyces sp. SP2-10]MBY8843528.1 hypothetical protein [Streptomyces sp. SP2-10]